MQKRRPGRLVLQLLMGFFFLELFLRIIFYQQFGRERLATVEAAKNVKRKIVARDLVTEVYRHYLVARPDSGQEVNKRIAREAIESNYFEYTPWVEYKNIDFSGTYFNTHGMIRSTIPDSFTARDATQQVIYFLGGSTMYGINITDRETIAAAFVNEYKERFPRGASIKVVNYGVSAYHSYNELMLLSHLIYSGQHPGIVVVMDGLNDFLMPTAALKRIPYYYYRLRQASKDKLNLKELQGINDSTATLNDYPDSLNATTLADTLTNNYLSNINQFKKMGTLNNFRVFVFVQPNPFFNYPNKMNDPICDKQAMPLVEKAYGILEKKITDSSNCFFLGNMLANEKGVPFIDRFHYAPAMCRRIAAAMVSAIGEKINTQ